MSRRRPSPTAPIADGPRSVWEQYYADGTPESPPGLWLDAHLPADPRTLLAARWRRNPAAAIGAVARVRPRALDLGCGAGHNTAWLLAHGF
ncbi:MAG: hypothetical protein LBV28_05855, partial [Puniceicoccales bacterium]|nr:hypothetical protein [Puniceicoccales bacterium]